MLTSHTSAVELVFSGANWSLKEVLGIELGFAIHACIFIPHRLQLLGMLRAGTHCSLKNVFVGPLGEPCASLIERCEGLVFQLLIPPWAL